MAIWGPDKRSSWEPWFFQNMASTLPYSRTTYQSADWLWFPNFGGKNNLVVCQKLSICPFQYFASKKHCSASFMSPCFEVIDWCMLEGMTQKWTKQGNYPREPPWSSLMNWKFLHWERGKTTWEDCCSPQLRNFECWCTHGPFQIQETLVIISLIVTVIPSEHVRFKFNMISFAESIILLSSVLVLCAQGDLLVCSSCLSDFRFVPECQPYHTIISSS